MIVIEKKIERVTIVGRYSKDEGLAQEYITKHGYKVTSSGPKLSSDGLRASSKKFEIVGEREIDEYEG